MKKFLSIFLAIIMIVASMPVSFAASDVSEESRISFSDVSNRLTSNSELQIWKQDGVTVTNKKYEVYSKVSTSYNPLVVNKKTQLIIEHPGMTEIVISCADADSAINCDNADFGFDIVEKKFVEGNNVIIYLKKALHSITITDMSLGFKIKSISVFHEEVAAISVSVNIDTGSLVTLNDSDKNGYYEIGSPDQLYAFAYYVFEENNTVNGELVADITVNKNVLDADGNLKNNGKNLRSWKPIAGHGNNIFGGSFDGANHTISGIYYNDSGSSIAGLFGSIWGNVRNVRVIDSYIEGYNNIGGIAGRIENEATVFNCYFEGTIKGRSEVGGIAGLIYRSVVDTCYSNVKVNARSEYTAALIGKSCTGTVINSHSSGSVSGPTNVGGIVGYCYSDTVVDNCHNSATVYADEYYGGGIVGQQDESSVTNSYNTGYVSGYRYIGGIVGYNDGSNDKKSIVDNCYNDGEVFGTNDVGGITGETYKAIVKNSYNKGNIIGEPNERFSSADNIAGVVGSFSFSQMENCYNIGTVTGIRTVGGVVGRNYDSTVLNSYNTGTVSGESTVSGVVGYNKGSVENCYNTAEITATDYSAGGVAGENNAATVFNCYNTGKVFSHTKSGGIIGYNKNGTVLNCYNTAAVTSTSSESGGIIGSFSSGSIKNCFNTGAVTAKYSYIGGIIGYRNKGHVDDCYYLSSTAKGAINGADEPDYAEGKTSEQFSSGEVAYLLQSEQTEHAWGQKTGTDELPVFAGTKVYKHSCCSGEIVYNNSEIYNTHSFKDSVCTVCGSDCEHPVIKRCVCSYCSAEVHDYEETFRFDATCNSQGVVTYTCNDCGDEYNEIIAASGHKFTYTYDSNTHKGVCEYCGYINQYVHEFEREYFDPTCETDGYYTDTCKCGYTNSKTTSTKYYHTGGEATCYSLAICDRCGESYGDYLDHTGGKATCTEPAKCEVCGEPYGEAKGHIADMDDGDCTTDIPCSVCGVSYIKGNAVHTWNENNFCANENCRQPKGFTFTFTYGDEVLFVRNVHTGNFYHFESAEERDGLTLLGWDEDGDGVIDYTIDDYIYIDEDRTFEAVYGLIYTIHYITYDIWNNCYDEVFFPQEGEPGDTITLYEDYSYYYKFLGWALEEDGEVVYEPCQEITLTENLTLYGIIRPYQATFDIGEGAVWNDEEGNPITMIQGDYEASWIEIYDFPTKTGYIFTGFADQYGGTWSPWEYDDTGLILDFYFDGRDLEMTAQWERCRNHNYIDDVCEYCGLNSADECKHPTGTQTCMGYKCDNCGDFYGDAGDHYGTVLTCMGYVCDTCNEYYGETVGKHKFENGICTVCDAVSSYAIVLEMRDAYGDGWNRAKLAVYSVDADGNETEYKVFALESGDSLTEIMFPEDGTYRFYWISGDYDYECGLTIMNGDETVFESYDCSEIPENLLCEITISKADHVCEIIDEWVFDSDRHWKECKDSECTNISDEAPHSYTDGICVCGYECPHAGQTSDYCSLCNKYIHKCKFENNNLFYNETYHWKECYCGEKTELLAHNYEDGICSDCDYECSHKGQTGDYCELCEKYIHRCDFDNIEWNSDEANHWKECDCGESTDLLVHNYKNGVCIDCGFENPDNDYILGDVNGDGVVDSNDAIHLLYYTLLPDRYDVNQDCDFDNDNSVNSNDAIYLLYHTLLPDRYPLVLKNDDDI